MAETVSLKSKVNINNIAIVPLLKSFAAISPYKYK